MPAEICPAHQAMASRSPISYTSGSTGEPKGIEICHRSIIRLVKNVSYVRLGTE
ncbi:MAG: AMP-binding protein, partial [Betaproteobacteria bacterium]|nr:AMP-binding protein [Betaproteobacteria bacterium]